MRKRIKRAYHRLGSHDDTPERIGRGFGIGVFWGMSTFLGLHMVFAFISAHFLKGNRVIAPLATWVFNPFTAVPVMLLNFKLGHLIFYPSLEVDFSNVKFDSIRSLLDMGWDVFFVTTLGSIILGSALGILGYVIIKPVYIKARKLYLYKNGHQKNT